MATLFQATGGTTTLLPTTTWAAPNALFPTTDRNDGTAYTWSSSTSTVTLPSSGLADGYLFVWGFEHEDTSNGRHNPQGRMIQASGTGNFASASTGGYNRDNSEDRSYVSGWSFVDGPSASATFTFQWRRDTDAPTGGSVRSYIQAIPLYYADAGIYTSTSTTATGGTTPVQITGLSGTDGTNITIATDTVSVTGDNKRYLVLGSAYHQNIGNARTQRWYGLRVDGTKDDAAKGAMYYRSASDADGGSSFMRLLETVTATRTVDLFQYRGDGVGAGQGGADVDGNTTGANSSHALVVLELNDSAEVFSSTDSVGGQEFALAGPVDVDIASTGDIEFNDAASFTRSTDTGVNAEVDMDVLAFANVSHAREASSIGSGARWTVHGEFTLDGTEQTGVGFHGNYNRGNQTSTDCMGSSTNQAAFFAVTTGQDIGVSNQELAGTEGGAGDIETQAGWVGFGLLNLDTLEAAGSDTEVSAGVDALTLAENQATISVDVEISAGTDALTLTEYQASISVVAAVTSTGHAKPLHNFHSGFTKLDPPVAPFYASNDIEVSAGVDALVLTENAATITLDADVAAGTDALILAEFAATITSDVGVSGTTAALTLATFAATITSDVEVSAGTDALTLATFPATLSEDTNVSAGVDNLTLTENAATITIDTEVSAGVDALTLATFAATITEDVDVSAGTDALTLATFAATITFDVEVTSGTAALVITTYPVALDESTNIIAGVAALTLTENQATISVDVEVAAGTDALTLTEFAATIDVSGSTNVITNLDTLVLTEYPATILSVSTESVETKGLDGGESEDELVIEIVKEFMRMVA